MSDIFVLWSLKKGRKSRFAKEPSSVKEPLVSVKMITYNHASYIGQAIEGVVGQKTTFPFELVIGEDCSTDGTREIVFEYQKKFPDIIRVITSDKNVGGKKNSRRVTKLVGANILLGVKGMISGIIHISSKNKLIISRPTRNVDWYIPVLMFFITKIN